MFNREKSIEPSRRQEHKKIQGGTNRTGVIPKYCHQFDNALFSWHFDGSNQES